jgi:replicative DNA helicase
LRELHRQGVSLDSCVLDSILREKRLSEKTGGAVYLNNLLDYPIPIDIEFHCKRVSDFAVKRRLLTVANKIIQSIHTSTDGIDALIDFSQKAVFEVENDLKRIDACHVQDVIIDTMEYIDDLFSRKKAINGVTTGFKLIDRSTAGLQQGDLIILAARPSIGKTAFALNLTLNTAKQDNRIIFFSLEMSKKQLMMRMLATLTGVNAHRIRTGQLINGDSDKLRDAAMQISQFLIYIDDEADLSAIEIQRRARRHKRRHGLDLCVIDYLGLARGEKKFGRTEEISGLSRAFKTMAKELNIPVLLLAQLNRNIEQRAEKRPILSDLRDSGAIEQDADVIFFLYRESVYNEKANPMSAEFIIGKQRQGPAGMSIPLHFNKETMTFFEIEKYY